MENKVRGKMPFPYSPGDRFKRSEMHELVGGSFRHGMTSCSNGAEFLLFHDAKKSKKFGYDIWEGFQADGSFHYSGQGTSGDQELTKSNAALITAHDLGKRIHLIESVDGVCTYLGRFVLGEPKYFEKMAPDISQADVRRLYVFNLLPVDGQNSSSTSDYVETVRGVTKNWSAPEFSKISYETQSSTNRQLVRAEFELQARFGEFLNTFGHTPYRHEFKIEKKKGSLTPDFWVPCLGIVVEAKPTLERETLRLAVGQVLDYAELSSLEGVGMSPFLLLPDLPSKQLFNWIRSLNIHVVNPHKEGFRIDARDVNWFEPL
jgi:hypothetical protein